MYVCYAVYLHVGDRGRRAVSVVHKGRVHIKVLLVVCICNREITDSENYFKLGLSKEHTHLFLFFASFRLMVLNLPNVANL